MTEHFELPADWREQFRLVKNGAVNSEAVAKAIALVESWRPASSPEGGDSTADETRERVADAIWESNRIPTHRVDADEAARMADVALSVRLPASSVRDTAETSGG